MSEHLPSKTTVAPLRFSILVEARDVLAFIPLFFSLVRQTYPEWELLIVRGKVSRLARRMVDDVAAMDARVRLLECDDPVGQATGQFLAQVSEHHVFSFNALEELVTLAGNTARLRAMVGDHIEIDRLGSVETRVVAYHRSADGISLANNTLVFLAAEIWSEKEAFLAARESIDLIGHIPLPLYSLREPWRADPTHGLDPELGAGETAPG